MTRELSVRRKADRAAMAKTLIELVRSCGASAELDDLWSGADPRCLLVRITGPRGLCVNIDFDGASPLGETHVLSWYIASGSDARLDPDYFPGSVNTVHFHKGTQHAMSFTGLCQAIEGVLRLASSGHLFQQTEAVA